MRRDGAPNDAGYGGPGLGSAAQIGTRRAAAARHWKQSSFTVSTSFWMSGPKFCVDTGTCASANFTKEEGLDGAPPPFGS